MVVKVSVTFFIDKTRIFNFVDQTALTLFDLHIVSLSTYIVYNFHID